MDKEMIWKLFKELDTKLFTCLDPGNLHYIEARKHLLNARMLHVHSLFFDEDNFGL